MLAADGADSSARGPAAAAVAMEKDKTHAAFEDCPLIEIVHFHECLRGEMRSLRENVTALRAAANDTSVPLGEDHWRKEVQIHSQFQLLWAVFQSHSTAEDETIWPALKRKHEESISSGKELASLHTLLDEEEYTEEHSQEQQLFRGLDELMQRLRAVRLEPVERRKLLAKLELQTETTCEHLLCHLNKEETRALPLLKLAFSHQEMEGLVGCIMGKRPSELMRAILGMMIKNLPPDEVGSMMGFMRQAVKDTYFEKWLNSGGFTWEGVHPVQSPTCQSQEGGSPGGEGITPQQAKGSATSRKRRVSGAQTAALSDESVCHLGQTFKELKIPPNLLVESGSALQPAPLSGCSVCNLTGRCPRRTPLTQGEFEKSVRVLATAGECGISPRTKGQLIQALRSHNFRDGNRTKQPNLDLTPPKFFYSGTDESECGGDIEELPAVPALFTRSELESTYHVAPVEGESGEGACLGCLHYRRQVKLRAPCCSRLFTCRLCHDCVMDHTMDRYTVSQMLCMRCGALQPAGDRCCNKSCPTRSEFPGPLFDTALKKSEPEEKDEGTLGSLSRYYCDICHLHDNAPDKDIYHCPYCNVCRLGKGLGVDFWHCMKCNACISMSVGEHKCITHSLEGNCPICSTSMFESRQQIKGLKCGHFMHLSCYREYVKRSDAQDFWYRCPICLRSMEDMREYFSQLDAVAASQPMPPEFKGWSAKILCHDCDQFSQVPYHFCYHKCKICGSYNTRVEEQSPT